MRTSALVAALALAAALAGCSDLLGGRAAPPTWVETPEAVGDQGRFLTAQGQAGPGLPEEAGRQADDAARTQLAAVVSEYADTTAVAFLTSAGAADSPLAQQFTATLATTVSTALLRTSISRDTWNDADGVAHVLYRVPIALVNDKIVEATQQTVPMANPFGKDAAEVAAQMEQFLQGRLAERLKLAARTPPPAPAAPAPDQTPAWLEADRYAAYPSEQYLSAIGLGADEQAAADSARAELAATIDTRLQGQLRALLAAPTQGPTDENMEHLGPGSLHFTSKDLAATRIAERWHDTVTDTRYALAVLDRAGASLIYRQRLSDAVAKEHDLSASAESNRNADKFAAALVDYLDALVAATDAFRMHLAALAAAPDSEAPGLRGATTEPLVAQVKTALGALLEQIRLSRAGGEDQWVAPGGAPRAPLVVQVTAGTGNIPLPGVPVRLTVPGMKDPVQCRTDEAGSARCIVPGPLPAAPSRGTVTAALDLGQLAAGADLAGLKPPQVDFHYALRSRDNTLIALYLYDVGPAGAAAPVTAELKAALSSAGFRLMDDARVREHVRAGKPAPDAPPAQAVDAAGMRQSLPAGQSLLVVAGRLRTHLVDSVKVSGGVVKIVYCDYSVAMIDTAAPEQSPPIMTADGNGQGAYTDDEVEATSRATADAASAIGKKLVAELSARFGPAPAAR